MTTTMRQTTARPTPGRGDIVPVLRGETPGGEALSTRDYYMRRNLAIVFASDDDEGAQWIRDAADVGERAQAEAGQVVIVVPASVETFGLPTLLDADGELRSQFGLEAGDLPALFITDRYGTVFVATQGADGDASLRPADVPRWLEFVACRCS